MTSAGEGSGAAIRVAPVKVRAPGPRSSLVALLASAVLAAGCTRPLLERAIDARGGAIESVSREATADVEIAFPGRWAWRFDYRTPDLLRWTLDTYGETQSVAFDGRTVHYFLGSARLPSAPETLEGFGTLVRWTAVTTLDAVVDDPGVSVRELAAHELSQGTASGLEVTYADGARYVLHFDADTLLIGAEGPIDVPTIAHGRMRASYADFRVADGFVLPALATYTLDGRPFLRESVTRWIVNDPQLTPASFSGPPPRLER